MQSLDVLWEVVWQLKWVFAILFTVVIGSKVIMAFIKAYKRAK